MTWDKQYFPNPAQLQQHIAAYGRKTIAIIDPHMKRDDGYRLFSEARDKGLFVKTHDGNDFDGYGGGAMILMGMGGCTCGCRC